MTREMAEDRPAQKMWIVALALTTLVTLAGFVVSVQQFVVKYLIDHWPHTRTLRGMLFMWLGIAGIGLPALLLLKRKKFASRPASRQWLVANGVFVFLSGCGPVEQR